jgi:hypothetical protein
MPMSRLGRLLRAAVLAALLCPCPAFADPGVPGPQSHRGFDLLSPVFAVLVANRVSCNLNRLGEVCVDPTNSPSTAGGFWPRGTPDNYIFNSGLQIAGLIPAYAGFAWAGDTVGVFFADPRGNQTGALALTPLYSSLEPADLADWPTGALLHDTRLFAPALLGRKAASSQDVWVRLWDGSPRQVSGRTHPMGLVVDLRGMAWNYPAGNEDVVYFVYDLYNVTAAGPAAYASLDPAVRDEIAGLGRLFQDSVESALGVAIPDGGYRLAQVYAGLFMDPDVGDAGSDYSSALLPFNMTAAYESDFRGLRWYAYPPEIFGAPFVRGPGFVGVRYLRSPAEPVTGAGHLLTMFSNNTGAATGWPDARGVSQLWRYLSGNLSRYPVGPDNACWVVNPIQRRLCALVQAAVDTRYYAASGPFTLAPGEVRTIVLAYVHAAAPAAVVGPFVGRDLKPGIPPAPDALALGTDTLRTLDRATGWENHADLNGDGEIEGNEVTTLRRSLLWKAQVAQAMVDNKFLVSAPPEPPAFFLVPGDNQVTVVWEPSITEQAGDPYDAIASAPMLPNGGANPLFDPNFRRLDVEGYRIYRGRTASALELIAQFDYETTTFVDYTGAIDYGRCAPELGVRDDCPVAFDSLVTYGGPHAASDIVGDLVQIPLGGRVLLEDGSFFVAQADTAVTGGRSDRPALENTGVPFAFVDRGVVNSLSYVYGVTAFDVNSLASSPSSLESDFMLKHVVPRAASAELTPGATGTLTLVGGDGTLLDPAAPVPALDRATGIFAGPMPPTDGIDLGLAALVSEIVTDGEVTVTVDSVLPGAALDGRAVTYFLTGQGSGQPVGFTVTVQQSAFGDDAHGSATFPATGVDSARAALYGGSPSAFLAGRTDLTLPGAYRITTWGRGDINGDPANSAQAGPRWWAGADNETTADPNASHCTPTAGGCVQADLSRTAGELPGVDVLFHVLSYATVPNVPQRNLEALTAGVARAADFRVHWGVGGAVDSVVDVTHHVRVPFSPAIRASWGILNASGFAGTDEATTSDGRNAVLTWSDIFCVDPAPRLLGQCGGVVQVPATLSATAELSPIAASASTYAGTASLGATGSGFVFYLNGHWFLMQLATLPAAGTVWHARFFAGAVTGTAAADDYAFVPAVRPPAVPGLALRLTYTGARLVDSVTTPELLDKVHTVPDPYYVTNAMELNTNAKVLKFVNLPAKCVIRVYSLSGVLLRLLTHNDPTGGGEESWDLLSRTGRVVASGVYLYHVETPDGRQKIGRLTVVNYTR